MMTDRTDEATVKLVDFGLATVLSEGEKSTEPFGTLTYVAPEVLLKGALYDHKVDSWSLGVVLYVLLSGTLPFDTGDSKKTAERTIDGQVSFDNPVWD